MKTHNGFISNSSSSSFIIASKNPLKIGDLIGPFEIGKNTPLYSIIQEMADILFKNAVKYKSIKDYCKKQEIDFQEVDDEIREMFDLGWNIYVGEVCDDGNEWSEAALCNIGLDYKSKTLIIKKEAGY